jgi:hypothetical protein
MWLHFDGEEVSISFDPDTDTDIDKVGDILRE